MSEQKTDAEQPDRYGIHEHTTHWIRLMDEAHVSAAFIEKPTLEDIQSFIDVAKMGVEIAGKMGDRTLRNPNGPTVGAIFSIEYLKEMVRFLERFYERNGHDEENPDAEYPSPTVEIFLSQDGPLSFKLQQGMKCETHLAPRKREP